MPETHIPTETVTTGSLSWQSTTSPAKPMTNDHIYHFLPYWDNKPCMHVRSVWPDYRRRMYNSNIIARIVDKLVSNVHNLVLILILILIYSFSYDLQWAL